MRTRLSLREEMSRIKIVGWITIVGKPKILCGKTKVCITVTGLPCVYTGS